jgi:hypothetical protein
VIERSTPPSSGARAIARWTVVLAAAVNVHDGMVCRLLDADIDEGERLPPAVTGHLEGADALPGSDRAVWEGRRDDLIDNAALDIDDDGRLAAPQRHRARHVLDRLGLEFDARPARGAEGGHVPHDCPASRIRIVHDDIARPAELVEHDEVARGGRGAVRHETQRAVEHAIGQRLRPHIR